MFTHRCTVCVFLFGCTATQGLQASSTDSDAGDSDGAFHAKAGNPIIGDDRLTPFPSAYQLQEDADSKTGVRVALDSADLPVSLEGVATASTSFPQADGFSPATPILVYLEAGVDASNLPPITDPGASLLPDSPTVLVDMAKGERIAHFAELDQNADPARGERQALILRPTARLPAATRIAVALTSTLRTRDGSAVVQPEGMATLLSEQPTGDDILERLRARSPAIVAALGKAGVAKSEIVIAWDFVTASDEFIHAPVLSMRDQALGIIGDDGAGLGFSVDEVDDDYGDDGLTLRRVRGRFETPLFLSAEGGPEGVLVTGADDGLPALQGTYEQPFTLIIPARAQDERPLPLMIWGHGLLGNGEESVSDAVARGLAETQGYVVVGTDWTGLSYADQPTVATALTNINEFARVTDKLEQAIINVIVLTRVARDQLRQHADIMVHGEEVIDPAQVYYNGNSLGGIMGAAMLGRAVDIERGVIGVPGCNWGLLIQRSSNWPAQEIIFSQTYPDPFDQLALLTLGQSLFDFSDPIHVAPHLTSDPLPGTRAKKILIQAGIGDAQVANITTDVLARTMGVSMVAPAVKEIFGLTAQDGPLESGLVYFDYGILPPTLTNAAPTQDNIVHGAVRQEPAAQRQLGLFLRPDGVIENTCDGACDCTTGACQ